jgi:type II secretion system protein C
VGGALLQAVYRDHVVLDRSGNLETLKLPHLAVLEPAYQPVQSPPVAVDEAAVEPADAHKLADVMRIGGSVDNGDGKLHGFRIYPGKSRLAFSGAGLHGGDLVIAVNGTSVEDQGPQQGQQVFDAFKSSAIAMLTVERNGQTRDITVDVAQAGTNASTEPASDPGSATPAQ